MKLSPVRSIVFFVTTLLVVIVTLSVSIYGYFNYSEIKKGRVESLQSNLSKQINQISKALALPVWNIDDTEINIVIESFLFDSNISAVVVDLGKQGKRIRIRDSNWEAVKSDIEPTFSEGFKEQKTIVYDNKVLGSVQLFATAKFIQRELTATVIRLVIFAVFLDLVLVALLYFILSYNVLKPLAEIERFAVTVNLDGKARNVLRGEYFLIEFENLSNSIEAMVTQLVKAKNDAEVAVSIKSQFLDIAAHELKTPVTALSLLAELTSVQLNKGVPVSSVDVERIKKHIYRLKTLVEDLLNVSHLEKGFLVLRKTPTDIQNLVEESVSFFRTQSPSREFKFLRSSSQVIIDIDPERITQVLSNLLSNAINYSPEGSSVEVTISSTPTDVKVAVRDHGPGISAELQKQLFTQFFRVTSNETHLHPGLGLGLYISRRIIESHGGVMELDSEVGKGSTFYFILPINTLV